MTIRRHIPTTPGPSARWALSALSLAMLLSSLGTSSANVALPTLVRVFGTTFQHAQWIVLAYLLAVTTLIVGVGRLGDLFGRRRLMLSGLVLFTTASVLCGLAPSLALLVAARAAQGLGAAVLMALTLAFVGEIVPKARIGSTMGWLGTMSAIGTALGPSLGGVLIAWLGWRAIFLVNLPLGLLAYVLAYRHLPVDHRDASMARVRFDHPGASLLAAALAAYALALTMGRGHFSLLNATLLLVAAIGAGLFVVVEKRSTAPLIRLSMFQQPELGAAFALGALVTTVLMATLVVGPFYLSGALGLDTARVGLVMTAGPIVAALTGLPAGRAVDRFGTHRMSVAGLIAIATGCTSLAWLPLSLGIPGYIAPIVVVTAGYAVFQAANNTSVLSNISSDQRGAVSGILNLSRNLGLITGASAMGAVFAHAAGATNISAANRTAVAAGMHATFAVAALLIVLALVIALGSRALAARPSPVRVA